MKVGILGLGHVGHNIERRLQRLGVDVVTHDRAIDRVYPDEALRSCTFVVVSVGTPARPDGRADLTDVCEAVYRVPCNHILIRSTVPPGTTEALSEATGKAICFSPEYVGETAFTQDRWEKWAGDSLFQILGGPSEVTRWFAEQLTSVYGPEIRLFQCSAVEAEIMKYMENSYLAMKVTFVNEFFELCQSLGADWYTVREGWLLDPRIERDHTAVFPASRGYDGRCLPKDIAAILDVAAQHRLPMPLMTAVRDANALYRARSLCTESAREREQDSLRRA